MPSDLPAGWGTTGRRRATQCDHLRMTPEGMRENRGLRPLTCNPWFKVGGGFSEGGGIP